MNRNSVQTNPPLAFRSAIWLEKQFSFTKQRTVLFWAIGIFSLGGVTWLVFGPLNLLSASFSAASVKVMMTGGLVVAILGSAIALLVGAVHAFYLYYRLSCISANDYSRQPRLGYTYPAAVWLAALASGNNPLVATRFGRELLLRVGVTAQSALEANPPSVDSKLAEHIRPDKANTLTLPAILKKILEDDDAHSEWLLSLGVDTHMAQRAAQWVERRNQRWVRKVRFWAPDRLAEISRVGQQINYGQTPHLDSFTHAPQAGIFAAPDQSANAFIKDTRRVLQVLTRPRSANALLIGEAQTGVDDVIREVSNQLQTQEAPPSLADYQLRELSLQSLITTTDTGPELEQLLTKLLGEAVHAGNILLVIKDFPRLLAVGEKRGVDMVTLLQPFMRNHALPILATARADDYYGGLQHSQFMQWLGAVEISDPESDTFLSLLEEVAENFEGEAVCTVAGLQAVIRYGRELITDDKMPHAAVDLLLEILHQTDKGFIDRERVKSYVANKTDLPIGDIGSAEKEDLMNLEAKLHRRVIGQDAAISAVSSALRRSRAGLEDSQRPIGSFLFLGPTGVGKTETAKAVAETYFDNESVTLRFDMSEFTSAQSVTDLIGEAESDGRLSKAVRSNPYGVMLLDEFEKAHSDIHDLFLQILDEGYFTDAAGNDVSCSNLVIIATSNAGAEHIFSLVSDGVNPANNKREVIDQIIADNILRPELINRFTKTVIFRPLTRAQLTAVTKKFLQQLKTRLRDRGMRLQIEDGVAQAVAEAGYDPQFGARAVRRYLQQTAENIIADKIIAEGGNKGEVIHLSVADIDSAETETDTT